MASMTLSFALSEIPDNLFFSVVVKSSVLRPFPATLSTLSFNAAFITLFCTGFVEVVENVASTVVLLAPAAIPESFCFSSVV